MKPCSVDGCNEPKPRGIGRHYCHSHSEQAREERRRTDVERVARWRKENPERHRMTVRAGRYGMTADEYGELIDWQDGNCAICLRFGGLDLEIDHDHDTGHVRGLLCGPCNRLLALASERAWVLEGAVLYLTHPPTRQLAEVRP